jgi:molecular chaperone DnaJ
MTDFYVLLGVERTANDEEIKRAYRQKARQLHPDANPGDPEAEARFKEVSVAYEVLRDPERRARYDRYGPQAIFGSAAGSSTFNFDAGLNDLFEAFFGAMGGTGGGRRGPVPGSDAEVALELEFREAVFGARKELSVRLPVGCTTCSGRGAAPGTDPLACPDCQGTGEIRRISQSILGQVVRATTCARCRGVGETIPTPCADCGGEGRRMEDRSFAVDVPAGVEDGSTLRLAGRGPAGPRGGPNGSLFVHLSVAPDPRFERLGDDLHTTLTIPMTQAALGGKVLVETMEDTHELAVAAGTASGHTERLRHQGVPHLRGRGRGDLYVHLAVETPSPQSARQEELLRQLAAERNEDVAPAGGDGVFSRIRSAFG